MQCPPPPHTCFQSGAVDTERSSHMILKLPLRCLTLPLPFTHSQGEELRPLPSSNPNQQVLYYRSTSSFPFFLLLTPPILCEQSVHVCVRCCPSLKCLVITLFTSRTELGRFTLWKALIRAPSKLEEISGPKLKPKNK